MTRIEKLLAKMRNSQRDWSIDVLKTLATRHRLDWRQPGTSHVTFSYPGLPPLTVPAHKPIKPIYVMRFVALLDSIGEKRGD
ncbi:MAG: type II toxin-antitoxin system HicA family toxin [Pseudomonadota bacterium]|nr:type II toxin-antitoxin system HicA family toxin [Pseudomonadota bacterium]